MTATIPELDTPPTTELSSLTQFERIPSGGRVRGAMQMPNAHDGRLWLVLVELPRGTWVTWICNTQTWGYSGGQYHTTSGRREQNHFDACQDFLTRGAEKLQAS